MSIKLTILGSGSALPTLYRGVTSQYLNFNERRILIDCGEGTQIRLREEKIKFQRLQHILISHLHGDHFQGLFGLLSSMNLTGRTSKLTIYSPPGLEEYLQLHIKTTRLNLKYQIEIIEMAHEGKEVIFEDRIMKIYAFPVNHRIPTYGFLFEEKNKDLHLITEKIQEYELTVSEIKDAKAGKDVVRGNKMILNQELTLPPDRNKSYAYCSDTAPFPELAKWVKGADLLYHEATFAAKDEERAKKTKHSTAEQAARLAKEAHAKRLILGHFSARYKSTDILQEQAEAIFAKTVCVKDGDTFLV